MSTAHTNAINKETLVGRGRRNEETNWRCAEEGEPEMLIFFELKRIIRVEGLAIKVMCRLQPLRAERDFP